MIRKQNGELIVDLNGTEYTLALTLSSMASLEDMFGMTFDEVTEKAQNGSMTHFRGFFWALLQKHHEEISVKEAGNLVTIGKLQEIANSVLAEAVKASQPDPKDVKEVVGKGKKENPTKARVGGTGASSTSPLEASA